jgi:hypothetical protein
VTKTHPNRLAVTSERLFSAHHILLRTANKALRDAELEPEILQHQLIAMTFSALALEALSNRLGEQSVSNWRHFERAPVIAKLRTVAGQLEIENVDFDQEPWSGALWLVNFRNKVAHAKPEPLKATMVMTEEEFRKAEFDFPQSKLELEISLANAKRAVQIVRSILRSFFDSSRVNFEDFEGILNDECSRSVSPLAEEAGASRCDTLQAHS